MKWRIKIDEIEIDEIDEMNIPNGPKFPFSNTWKG